MANDGPRPYIKVLEHCLGFVGTRNHTTHQANDKASNSTTDQEVQDLLQQGPSLPELATLFSHIEQSKLQSTTDVFKKE